MNPSSGLLGTATQALCQGLDFRDIREVMSSWLKGKLSFRYASRRAFYPERNSGGKNKSMKDLQIDVLWAQVQFTKCNVKEDKSPSSLCQARADSWIKTTLRNRTLDSTKSEFLQQAQGKGLEFLKSYSKHFILAALRGKGKGDWRTGVPAGTMYREKVVCNEFFKA